jgi:O-antigen/teichoic acid export membrane protein
VAAGAALPLRTTVLRGLGWLTGAQGARQALQLGFRVLLVRLLSPDDFGLLGMVTVVSGFLLMFNDLGFGPALVRQEAVTETELSTVFWLNLATGILLALATVALGPPLAQFYRQPALLAICIGLAWGALAAPLGTVHNALLQRRFAFRSLATIDLLGIATGGGLGVLLAATGHGIWALVWQSNATALVVLLVTVGHARWAPRRQFDGAAAARLWRFSGCLTAAALLNYWVRNLDNLLIGRCLGAAALGYYAQAYQMMLYPVQNVAALTGRVMFPSLARVQADPDRLRRAYVQALRGIGTITFPLMLGAMVLAPDLYAVLFGPKWQPSVLLFQILCGVGMLQSLGTTIGWIYGATGRTDLHLRWHLIVAGVIVPVFLIGLRWGGLNGLTIGYAVAAGLLFAPSLRRPFLLIRLHPDEAVRRLAPLLAAAAGMALAVAALRWSMRACASAPTRLLLGILFGAAVYPALLQVLGQAPLGKARSLWASLMAR